MISRLNANSSHILQHYDQVRAGKLEIEGGIYDLKSGRVEWLVRNFIQLHIRVKGMNSYTNLWVILIWFVGPPAECFFKPPMFVQVLGQKSSWVQTGENRQQRGPIFEAEDWRTIGGFSTSECDLCHCGPASRSFSIQFLPIWYLRNLLRVCVCLRCWIGAAAKLAFSVCIYSCNFWIFLVYLKHLLWKPWHWGANRSF